MTPFLARKDPALARVAEGLSQEVLEKRAFLHEEGDSFLRVGKLGLHHSLALTEERCNAVYTLRRVIRVARCVSKEY